VRPAKSARLPIGSIVVQMSVKSRKSFSSMELERGLYAELDGADAGHAHGECVPRHHG
jgi:hypothetical protein